MASKASRSRPWSGVPVQPAAADSPAPLPSPTAGPTSGPDDAPAARAPAAPSRWARLGAFAVRHALPVAGVILVAVAGGVVGAALTPSTTAEVGPLEVKVRVVPSLDPGVRLLLPPAGEVDFATHRAPFAIEGRIAQVDLEGARNLIQSPVGVRALGDTATPALRSAAVRAGLLSVGCGFAGAVVLSFLVYRRRWRRTAQVTFTVVGALVVTGTMAVTSADPAKLAQPTFTGLLSQAPYVAGQVPNVIDRLESYRSGLADIVRSVTALYATTGRLPTVSTGPSNVTTVLHVSDIHLNPLAYDLIERLVQQFNVDVVVDTGDIVTWGTDAETATLRRIKEIKAPYVFVRGNHDSAPIARAVAANPNATVLSDSVVTKAGITIAGIGDPVFTPDASDTPVVTPSGAASPSASPTPTPSATTPAPVTPSGAAGLGGLGGLTPVPGPQGRNNELLAETIRGYDADPDHAGHPVQLAAVHEPSQLNALLGLVPTIFAGHTHQRAYTVDPSGTRIMVEGSTGGAGITARGLGRLADGHPLPLSASLVYYAKTGPRKGQIVAVDTITVGGFGLASVNLQRTVFPAPPALKPPAAPTPSPSPSPTPAGTP